MAQVPADLRVCIFDVFGTVVDWRGSLIQDLPGLGKKYGMDTDWTSFADDWRGLLPAADAPRPQGRAAVDQHRRAAQGSLRDASDQARVKHPGEEGSWEFTRLWHKLRPWPDSVEGIGMMKKKYVVATLSNGNVALLINMAENGGIPGITASRARRSGTAEPDPRILLGVVETIYLQPHQVMLVRGAQRRPGGGAEKCGLSTGFVHRPTEHGPNQKTDLEADGEWNAISNWMIELAKKLGC